MKLDLDDKLVKQLLIGVVVIVVIIFIVWKWKSKSTYVYPEATTTPPLGTFTVQSVQSVIENTGTQTPYYLKITTSAAHGFVASGSARDTAIFRGFTTTPKISLNYPNQFILYSPPGVTFLSTEFAILVPPNVVAKNTAFTGTDAGATVESGFNNYKNRLQSAVNTYNSALANSTLSIFLPSTTNKTDSDAAAAATKQSTYTTASEEYVQKKCPYSMAANDYIDSVGKSTITFDPVLTSYNDYRGIADKGVSKILNEYITLISSSSSAPVSGTSYSSNTTAVQQSRKADITGATRAYLSNVCPGFYTDVAGSTLESTYKTWTPGGATYGFTKPSATQINNWASYAIDTSINGSVNADGKLVLSIAKDLKGAAMTVGGVAGKPMFIGSTVGTMSNIVSVVGGATTATVTTPLAHGLTTGTSVIMTGFEPTALNGTYAITVTTTTAFTIPVTGSVSHTTLGTITPLVFATATTSPQLIVYTVGTGTSSISKPAWQWARDYGAGTTATTLLPTQLRGWGTIAPVSTTTMLVDTTTYV